VSTGSRAEACNPWHYLLPVAANLTAPTTLTTQGRALPARLLRVSRTDTPRPALTAASIVQFGGRLDWDSQAICGDDQTFRGRGNPSTGDFFHAAPNVDHTQDFVREGITDWLNWLRTDIGVDGYRLDFVRGFGGASLHACSHVVSHLRALSSEALSLVSVLS
jgi:hypothetical protein